MSFGTRSLRVFWNQCAKGDRTFRNRGHCLSLCPENLPTDGVEEISKIDLKVD